MDTKVSLVSRGFSTSMTVSGPAVLAQGIAARKCLLQGAQALSKEADDSLRWLKLMQPSLGLSEPSEAAAAEEKAKSVFLQKLVSVPLGDRDTNSDWDERNASPGNTSSLRTSRNSDAGSGLKPEGDEPTPAAAAATPVKHAQSSTHRSPVECKEQDAAEKPVSSTTRLEGESTDGPQSVTGRCLTSGHSTPRPSGADGGVLDSLPSGLVSIVVVQQEAVAYVERARREQARHVALSELKYAWLKSYLNTYEEEADARLRLHVALLEFAEHTARVKLHQAYQKFVVFSVKNEPVWRKAAKELQMRNEERMNSAENVYARFVLAEDAYAGKQRLFQEETDYVLSLRIHYEDEMEAAARLTRLRRLNSLQTPPANNVAFGGSAAPPRPAGGRPAPWRRPEGVVYPERHYANGQGPLPPTMAPLTAIEVVPQRQFRDGGRTWSYVEHVNNPPRVEGLVGAPNQISFPQRR